MNNQEYIKNLTEAIKCKYGEHVIQPIHNFWNTKKELEYKKQIFKRNRDIFYSKPSEIKNEFIINKKLFIDKSERICNKCNKFNFNLSEQFYINKYKCCFKCYINFIDGKK